MREFLELTEQSQNLQIQFQHVSITNRTKFIRSLINNKQLYFFTVYKINLNWFKIHLPIMYHVGKKKKSSEDQLLF